MLIAQFFGVLAFLVGVFAFLQKQDSKYRYYMVGFCLILLVDAGRGYILLLDAGEGSVLSYWWTSGTDLVVMW